MSTTPSTNVNPEIGNRDVAGGIETNYHDAGHGEPVVLLHGSGPGVTAWANWRLQLPALAERSRVLAPDIVGFGYTQRPEGIEYALPTWLDHLVGFLDALQLDRVNLVGNSFGGALSLALAARHPDRVDRLVLMGSAGLSFPITPGLEAVWGYEPSLERMREMLDIFAHDRSLITDELADLRYQASIRPGVQEAYAAMFPAPRQQWIDALATPEHIVATLPHRTLVVHGREDRVLPMSTSLRLFELIPHAELHIFGECGHWTQIEHAGRFNQLVANFLDS